MKINLPGLLLASLLLIGNVSFAETPGDDSAVPYTGLSTPFSITAQAAIPVNESEVKAGLLYDAVNGKIVWQKKSQRSIPDRISNQDDGCITRR